MTGIVIDLDGQIERVFPHKFKMTETKAVVETSLSMSASLPLTLIEQVPKGLYQATDWRDGGGGGPELWPGSDAPSSSLTFTITVEKATININSKR